MGSGSGVAGEVGADVSLDSRPLDEGARGVRASGNTHEFKIGPGLDRAGLADALGRQAEALAGILIPDLQGLDAAAAYEPGTLRVEAVEATERPETYRLHFRFEWSAQHGCSDWSCRDQERQSALFRQVGDAAVFEVPADPGERTTRDEF